MCYANHVANWLAHNTVNH